MNWFCFHVKVFTCSRRTEPHRRLPNDGKFVWKRKKKEKQIRFDNFVPTILVIHTSINNVKNSINHNNNTEQIRL